MEVKGDHVLGVRADVAYDNKRKLWLPSCFQESRLEPVTPDILDQQRRKSWANQRRLEQGPEVTRDRGYGLGD